MKKPSIVVLFLVMLLTLGGRERTFAADNVNHSIPYLASQAAVSASDKLHPSDTFDSSIHYEYDKETFTDRAVMISYPQLKKLSNENKQQQLNRMIKSEALSLLRGYSPADLEGLSLTIDYVIQWHSPELVSIRYSGTRHLKNSPYPSKILFSTNLQLQSASKLRLQDLVTVDNQFVQKVKQGKLLAVSPKITLDLLKLSDEKLLNAFRTADSVDEPENPNSAFSYFSLDCLRISIAVSHALGDQIEFEVNYQAIADHINERFPLLVSAGIP